MAGHWETLKEPLVSFSDEVSPFSESSKKMAGECYKLMQIVVEKSYDKLKKS